MNEIMYLQELKTKKYIISVFAGKTSKHLLVDNN